MTATVLHRFDPNVLDRLATLPLDLAPRGAASVLAQLTREPTALDAALRSYLTSATPSEGPLIIGRYEGDTGGCSLQLFYWAPGAASAIHDHACWGALCCVTGMLREERYRRLDNGAQPNRARLRKTWTRVWRPGMDASCLLPYEGGIHRMSNPGREPAFSLHLYGPRLGDLDGRDYDPGHDFVCDRLDDEPDSPTGNLFWSELGKEVLYGAESMA